MVWLKRSPDWQGAPLPVTDEAIFWNRRRLLQGLGGAAIASAAASLGGCVGNGPPTEPPAPPPPGPTALDAPFRGVARNPKFADPRRVLTPREVAARYNNFYEFGGTKDIASRVQVLPTDPWRVEVNGLVNRPQTFDLDDLRKKFPLEERIYRFRCVEAWAMVVPWLGFPMHKLLAAVEPQPQAKFVRFTSFYDEKITIGPGWAPRELPWPYTEGLRLDEMANDLAFFAVGIYGQALPKQHGAPIRAVLPWKYGYKGAKSIVKIELLDRQPATFWNTLIPDEYDFLANVNPAVPHPRWPQSTERLVGSGPSLTWQRVPTHPYNGYGDYVASLYT